jgi:hypothetical protein
MKIEFDNTLKKFNLTNPQFYKDMLTENKRIKSYEVEVEFINPNTMQLVENKDITVWVDSKNILKASTHLYDNIRTPLIVRVKNNK